MRSSSDKRRDMARSILPSTARYPRKGIAAAKRANRRAIARHLAVSNGVPADWDDHLDGVDLRAYPDIEIGMLVRWRRGCDKLHHFERWAVRTTRHLPLEDRLSTMRAQLPNGLIGDHALSHLRALPELAPANDPDSWAARQAARAAGRAAAAERRAREAERRRARLVEVVTAYDGHRLLNRAMKAAPPVGAPPRWRTLAGLHDVDAFLAEVDRYPCWRLALDRFLAEPVTPAR